MHPLSYLHFQMQLAGKGLNGHRMVKEAGAAPGESLPLALIAQLRTQEIVAYYDASMPDDLQAGLAGCLPKIQFPRVDPLLEILNSHTIRARAQHQVTYLFPTPPPTLTDRIVIRYDRQDARLQGFELGEFTGQIYGIEEEGRVAAICVSARENEHCGAAWVYTRPEHRRHGLGKRVASAWARTLIHAGKVPFFICHADHTAAIGLAQNLDLQPIFEEINITTD
jgi:hypothetical protein